MGEATPGRITEIMGMPEVTGNTDKKSDKIESVTKKDLRVVVPKAGETVVVLQCNAKDNREIDKETGEPGPNYGKLEVSAAEEVEVSAKRYFLEVISNLNDEERKDIEIAVFATNAPLVTPESLLTKQGISYDSPHRRAFDTAELVIRGIRAAIEESGLDKTQLLNDGELQEFADPEGPLTLPEDLSGLKMLRPEHQKFVKALLDKYGPREMWAKFEEDADSKERKTMGVEGVNEVHDRLSNIIKLIVRATKERHKNNPRKRTLVWFDVMGDEAAPFVKGKITRQPQAEFVAFQKAGGVTIEVPPTGNARTEIGGKKFGFKL